MEAADKVLTVSNLTRNIVIEKYGLSPEKVVTVYNAVEPAQPVIRDRILKKSDSKIVTFLGRITMQKGPEYFVKAAERVLEKMDNVRFVMAEAAIRCTEMMIKQGKYEADNLKWEE